MSFGFKKGRQEEKSMDQDSATPQLTRVFSQLELQIDDPEEAKTSISRTDYSIFISHLYAILLVLIGLIFCLSEALPTRNKRLQTIYNAVFLTYLLTMAILCLLYFQLYLIPHSNKHRPKKDKSDFDAAKVKETKSGFLIQNADEPEEDKPTKKKKSKLGALKSKMSNSFTTGSSGGHVMKANIKVATSYTNLNQSETARDYSDTYRTANGAAGGGRLYTSASATLRDDKRKRLQLTTQTSVESLQQSEVGSASTDAVFIDWSKLGNIFSHEGSSFYLRLGSLLFGLGNIIYICLEIVVWQKCGFTYNGWIFIIRLIFTIMQTFFLFKNPTIEIRKHETMARFGFMHLIATNLCMWITTLVNEIMNEVNHSSTSPSTTPAPHTGESSLQDVSNIFVMNAYPPDLYSESTAGSSSCNETVAVTNLLLNTSAYLFPFVLEYSLIAVGTLATICSSINIEDESGNVLRNIQNLIKIYQDPEIKDIPEEKMLAKSHHGAFLGILLLASGILSIIGFYFTKSSQSTQEQTSEIIYLSSDIVIHILMLIAILVALIKLHHLSFLARPTSVDDMLIWISMSGAILLELALLMSSTTYIYDIREDSPVRTTEILQLVSAALSVVQTLLQVALILTGLRRYPSKQWHVNEMPGRGTISFLIIANVVVWIVRTTQMKQIPPAVEIAFYGKKLWLVILNLSLPLLLFFAFHSSVCLADIWHIAYIPLHKKMNSHKDDPDSDEAAHQSINLGSSVSHISRSWSTPQLATTKPSPLNLRKQQRMAYNGMINGIDVVDEEMEDEEDSAVLEMEGGGGMAGIDFQVDDSGGGSPTSVI